MLNTVLVLRTGHVRMYVLWVEMLNGNGRMTYDGEIGFCYDNEMWAEGRWLGGMVMVTVGKCCWRCWWMTTWEFVRMTDDCCGEKIAVGNGWVGSKKL